MSINIAIYTELSGIFMFYNIRIKHTNKSNSLNKLLYLCGIEIQQQTNT